VPACDVIVGPGNRWVTAAKHAVSAVCGIDMLAGPSELLVIADDTADPETVAADLIAQAEHDTDAMACLVTTDPGLPDRVDRCLFDQLGRLPTARVAREAITNNGWACVVGTLDEAIAVSDRIAPEHLEILCRDAGAVAARVRHAGGVFIGRRAAEVLGDYGAGPNHTLPTGRTARVRGGLCVFDFLRVRTWLEMDDPRVIAADAAALGRIEGLEGHARSAEARL
jgi:phosphoribosyl-ATP pyrophosphohydrolase/phosphoribosyl-AMP cyclohydrolase/histidinol dehydrogenase